jgi:hypothetical protein
MYGAVAARESDQLIARILNLEHETDVCDWLEATLGAPPTRAVGG